MLVLFVVVVSKLGSWKPFVLEELKANFEENTPESVKQRVNSLFL